MGAGARTQIITELPVVEVVRAATAGPGKARDFVVLKALRGQLVVAVLLHVPGEFVFGDARRRQRRELGARLQCQLIVRQVRRLQAQRRAQIGQCAAALLPRQGKHQIEVEVIQAAGVQLFGCAIHIGRRVDAAQHLQNVGIKTLRSQRHAGDAGSTIFGKAAALDRGGVGLEGDLGVSVQRQLRAQKRQHRAYFVGRKQAGRAAAQKHAVHGPVAQAARLHLRGDVGLQGLYIAGGRQLAMQGE